MDQKETTEKLDNITQTLQQMIERTQVKASLLKLESKETWQELEESLSSIMNKIEISWSKTRQSFDESQLQAHLGMMEAREQWEELKKSLSLESSEFKVHDSIDRARLQAHLAKMEGRDWVQNKRESWEKNYNEKVQPHLKSAMDEMHKEMQIFAKSLND